MNIKSSKTLVTEALSEIKTISPDEALSMMNEDKCNLIDIRAVSYTHLTLPTMIRV